MKQTSGRIVTLCRSAWGILVCSRPSRLGKWAENSRRLEAASFSFAPWQTRWEIFRNFASLLGPMLVGNAKIGKAKPKRSTETDLLLDQRL